MLDGYKISIHSGHFRRLPNTQISPRTTEPASFKQLKYVQSRNTYITLDHQWPVYSLFASEKQQSPQRHEPHRQWMIWITKHIWNNLKQWCNEDMNPTNLHIILTWWVHKVMVWSLCESSSFNLLSWDVDAGSSSAGILNWSIQPENYVFKKTLHVTKYIYIYICNITLPTFNMISLHLYQMFTAYQLLSLTGFLVHQSLLASFFATYMLVPLEKPALGSLAMDTEHDGASEKVNADWIFRWWFRFQYSCNMFFMWIYGYSCNAPPTKKTYEIKELLMVMTLITP